MPKGVLDPNSKVRCTAHKAHGGERCKNAAIRGGTVCRYHGGAAKQVQRSARQRFNDLIDPMINIAHKLAKEAEEGKLSPGDQIQLMKFIADRTGFAPNKVVTFDTPKWEQVMLGVIREMPEDMREIEASTHDIEDAVIVEDDPVDADDQPDNITRLSAAHGANERARVQGSADPPRHKPSGRY